MITRGGSSRRLAATVLAVAVTLAACTERAVQPPPDGAEPPAADDELEPSAQDEPCPHGTDERAVWVHDHEPDDWLVDDVDVRAVAGWVRHGLHEGLHRRDVDGRYRPQLLAQEPQQERDDDDRPRLRFELRDDLTFSDGTELTATHVRETYDLMVADDGAGADRLGDRSPYGHIDPDSWEVDGQRFAFSLLEEDTSWPTWFGRILPTHVLPDVDSAVDALAQLSLDGSPLPASGPFVAEGWELGERLTFVRNDLYHGPHTEREDVVNRGAACVSQLELRFVEDTVGLVGALRGGEADLGFVPPQQEIVELAELDVTVAVAPDPATESWWLNLADPHLRDPRVREALAASIDRAALVEQLHLPLLGEEVPVEGHDRLLFPAGVDTEGARAAGLGLGDPQRADTLLGEAGYDREGDGTYTHPERGTLTLRLSTTGDDQLRERQQQLLQNQLRGLGWDLEIDNRPGAAHLDEQVFAPEALACAATGEPDGEVDLPGLGTASPDCDRFDVAQVALHPSSWPVRVAERFRTGAGTDPTGLRSASFDTDLDTCRAEQDEDRRQQCAERLDRTLVTRAFDRDGLVAIPLAVRPHLHLDGPRVERRPASSSAPDAGPLGLAADLVLAPADEEEG